MFAWLLGLFAASIVLLFFVLINLRKAPEAFEDQHGLQIFSHGRSSGGIVQNKESADQERRAAERETEPHPLPPTAIRFS